MATEWSAGRPRPRHRKRDPQRGRSLPAPLGAAKRRPPLLLRPLAVARTLSQVPISSWSASGATAAAASPASRGRSTASAGARPGRQRRPSVASQARSSALLRARARLQAAEQRERAPASDWAIRLEGHQRAHPLRLRCRARSRRDRGRRPVRATATATSRRGRRGPHQPHHDWACPGLPRAAVGASGMRCEPGTG